MPHEAVRALFTADALVSSTCSAADRGRRRGDLLSAARLGRAAAEVSELGHRTQSPAAVLTVPFHQAPSTEQLASHGLRLSPHAGSLVRTFPRVTDDVGGDIVVLTGASATPLDADD